MYIIIEKNINNSNNKLIIIFKNHVKNKKGMNLIKKNWSRNTEKEGKNKKKNFSNELGHQTHCNRPDSHAWLLFNFIKKIDECCVSHFIKYVCLPTLKLVNSNLTLTLINWVTTQICSKTIKNIYIKMFYFYINSKESWKNLVILVV